MNQATATLFRVNIKWLLYIFRPCSDLRALRLGEGGTSSTLGHGRTGALSQLDARLSAGWHGISIAL